MSNKTIKLDLDDSGVVMNPGVHDAEILRIEIQGEERARKSALIACRSENKEKFVVHIEGIHFFSMNFLISQNVIRTFLSGFVRM